MWRNWLLLPCAIACANKRLFCCMPLDHPSPADVPESLTGLTSAEAAAQQKKFGPNALVVTPRNSLLNHLRDIVGEPMFILLASACGIYFFLEEWTEALMMLIAILFVSGIELYQEAKSGKAIEALRQYTKAKVRVLRDGAWIMLNSEELVPDDIIGIEEGELIPADGVVVQQNDLLVNESILTGESLPVTKSTNSEHRCVFQGTTVAAGKGTVRVSATGTATELGRLGKTVEETESAPTPLQGQIKRFVRQMGIIGGIAFAITFGLNYWIEADFWKALLFSLTLAMSILPQEIPVAFSAFMALGAYRMIRLGILAKHPKTVESLGSATVICLDKTGTITENKMSVAAVVDIVGDGKVLEAAVLASEPEPFDAMEKALLQYIAQHNAPDPRTGAQLVQEYALSGTPPMMTHVWQNANGQWQVAAKGAVERIFRVTGVGNDAAIHQQAEALTATGYRVLGVASAVYDGRNFPEQQDDFAWKLEGLVAFYDPPKAGVKAVFEQLYEAGIRIMMITGDHAATAKNIAQQTGIRHTDQVMTGDEVMKMDDTTLKKAVQSTHLFARMFPEAKWKVVNALKANGETVAMSGDGVNDGPALKSAQIGIAMGKKGTDIAKSAASLVLLDDNLKNLTTAVQMGRRIYANLRKAIRYVISIHLPIIGAVLVPLLLGWPFPHILLPLHVIFLELVMDPTAAIAFENEPAEPGIMQQPPRSGYESLFSGKELGISLLQGIMIMLGVLFMYQYGVRQGLPEQGVRACVFSTLVFANMCLTLTNRSFKYTWLQTLRYQNGTIPFILLASLLLLLAILYIPFLAHLFRVAPLSFSHLGWCALAGFVSVVWLEVYKYIK
jgi:P-type Ca2+ transporter type 2C